MRWLAAHPILNRLVGDAELLVRAEMRGGGGLPAGQDGADDFAHAPRTAHVDFGADLQVELPIGTVPVDGHMPASADAHGLERIPHRSASLRDHARKLALVRPPPDHRDWSGVRLFDPNGVWHFGMFAGISGRVNF